MDLLKRQARMAEQQRIARQAEEERKKTLIAANPKPPKSPTLTSSTKIDEGIVQPGTMRHRVFGRSRRTRKRTFKIRRRYK